MIEQQRPARGPVEEEKPKGRRELREERLRERRRRRWTGVLSALKLDGLAGAAAERLAPLRRKKKGRPLGAEADGFLGEDGAPKSRRELRRSRRRKELRSGTSELVLTVLVAFVVVFGFVRPFVVQSYKIPSGSMIPTLEIGDRVLANKFVYYLFEPEKGDIIVFDAVEHPAAEEEADEEDQTLIKRVVGVEGDRIRVTKDNTLIVNGVEQEEPYLNEELRPRFLRDVYGPERVPEGHVFVMGDNRDNSKDSRVYGPVPVENIQGEAFFRFWPIPRIGIL